MASGLPPLPPGVSVFSGEDLLSSDSVASVGASTSKWGIFLNGQPVVVADNVLTFGFKRGARISKYPQEQGAFASYNKVSVPATPRIRYSTGGSASARQAFLASIDPLVDDLNLYDVVTPEVTYSGYSVVDYEYPRSADNYGLIYVDVLMEQVVIAGQSQFSNTQAPSDSAQVDNGLVQPGSVARGPDLPNISGPVTFQ
jgi:hypothetical protein